MLIRLLLIFFALLPGALLAGFFATYFRRRLGGELAAIALGLGIISAFLILAVVWLGDLLPGLHLTDLTSALSGFGQAFLVAGLPEETVKFLLLMTVIRQHEDCDSGGDLFCSAVLIGLGFAAVENILYLAGNSGNWLSVGLLRGALAVPGHAIFGIVMGHYAAQAQRSPTSPRRRFRLLAFAWLAPVIIHTLYDFPLMTLAADVSDSTASLEDSQASLQLFVLLVAAALAWFIARQELVSIYRNRLDHDLELPSTRALIPWRIVGGIMILGAIACFGLAAWMMQTGQDHALMLFLPSIFPLTFGCIMQMRPPKELRNATASAPV